MMNYKKITIVLAIIMMAGIPLGIGISDESDAFIKIDEPNVTASGFTNNGDGTISVPLKSDEDKSVEIHLKAMHQDDTAVLKETTVVVPAGETVVAKLTFNISSVGEYIIVVECDHPEFFPTIGGKVFNTVTVDVNVTESIWSKWTTYAAVALVVILIVIAVVMKMRSAPSTKPTTSFTELEKQRTEGIESKPVAPSQPVTTERRRYNAPAAVDKPKDEPAPKKPTSFTELDREKNRRPEKSSGSDEPKKMKYVSSRRK